MGWAEAAVEVVGTFDGFLTVPLDKTVSVPAETARATMSISQVFLVRGKSFISSFYSTRWFARVLLIPNAALALK
jgi:hypothetical protein